VKDTGGTLLTLALQFSLLSFLAIGGAISALPEMHRQAVDVRDGLHQTFGLVPPSDVRVGDSQLEA